MSEIQAASQQTFLPVGQRHGELCEVLVSFPLMLVWEMD